jgi:DNA invertase Pin-like site-specific DNA recombinase
MPKAYSYSRFSSEKQARGDSLRRQTEKAAQFVIKRQDLGLELDTTRNISDPAMSAYRGTHLKRGALAAFITAVENGTIEEGSYLLIESFDRLSRQSSHESMTLLLNLVSSGVTVVTLNDERIYNQETISGVDGTFTLMQSLVSMARAHEESVTKGIRVKAAWDKKLSRIAEGVQLTKRVPFWLTADREVITEKAELVTEIFRMHGQGLGSTKIAKELNWRGISTPSGRGLWQQSTIRKLITGKHVLGTLTTADGTDHHDYFPQVIDEETWLEANVMAGSGQATKSREKPKPLAGIVRCKCGASMRHQSRTGRVKRDGTRNRWDYFVCATAAVGGNCPFISVPQGKVLSRLDAELTEIYQYAIRWSGETPTYEAKKLALRLAQEDLAASYELYKAAKSPTARARTAEFERIVQAIQKEVEELARAANDAGNNLVRTLLEAPRTGDNVWWRQFAKHIVIDTIEMEIEIHFHNGQTYSLCLEQDKYIDPGDIVNGASLVELIKNQ